MVWMQTQFAARREILRKVSLFGALADTEIDVIARHAITRSHPRGTIILHQGDPASAMLIVLQGRVRISVCADDGREANLRVIGQGEVIGEISLLDGRECSTTVSALETCTIMRIEREFFIAMLRGSSDLCLRLATVLCDRVRRATVQVEEALLLDLPSRLGRQLQRMADEHGIVTPEGIKISARLSQSDLAALIGASREKVNRQLKTWERTGHIKNRSGYIVLCDPDQHSGRAPISGP